MVSTPPPPLVPHQFITTSAPAWIQLLFGRPRLCQTPHVARVSSSALGGGLACCIHVPMQRTPPPPCMAHITWGPSDPLTLALCHELRGVRRCTRPLVVDVPEHWGRDQVFASRAISPGPYACVLPVIGQFRGMCCVFSGKRDPDYLPPAPPPPCPTNTTRTVTNTL